MNDGIAVEIIYSGEEAILEFLLGCYPDVFWLRGLGPL
jgi:hypothetical protein